MYYQNRSFFRKNIIQDNLKTQKLFKSHRVGVASNYQKLSPHKLKKTNLFTVYCPKDQYNLFKIPVILSSLLWDQHGNVIQAVLSNYLGVNYHRNFIKGISFSSFYKIHHIFNWKISTHLTIATCINSVFPVSRLQLGKNVLFTACDRVGVFNKFNELEITSYKKNKLTKGDFIIGRVSRQYTNHSRTLVKVRGIAKNPVDHPNGGRANTKGSFKTPWGSYAKNNK